MDERQQQSLPQGTGRIPDGNERLVYVVPETLLQPNGDEVSLLDLWHILWRGKWLIIGLTACCCIASIAYALNATKWYRAEVLLAPAETRSVPRLTGTLGGLASLAGVSVGGGDGIEPLAVLRSRDFSRQFIEEQNLLSVLFPDAKGIDSMNSGHAGHPVDIRDGVRYFNTSIRQIQQDDDTGLITLSVEWIDPNMAAEWANLLVDRINDLLRQRALREAEANVAYLQEELSKTSVVTLQQSISGLLESELQKVMLARGNEEFAFRVIDRAQPPKQRSRPQRTLIVALSTFIGGMISLLAVFVIHGIRTARKSATAH